MTLVTSDHSQAHTILADAQFIECWMSGTYVVAGIFSIPSDKLTIATIKENISILHTATKRAKKGWWPRGISGMFLLPVYLGYQFDPAVIEWVQQRRPYRWAVWHEPVLYDIQENKVWMRSDYGLFGSAYYRLVFTLYGHAFKRIAERLEQPAPDFINGKPVPR